MTSTLFSFTTLTSVERIFISLTRGTSPTLSSSNSTSTLFGASPVRSASLERYVHRRRTVLSSEGDDMTSDVTWAWYSPTSAREMLAEAGLSSEAKGEGAGAAGSGVRTRVDSRMPVGGLRACEQAGQ